MSDLLDLDIVFQSVALFIPILAANQAAHVVRVMDLPDIPTWRRVFGENKTLMPWLVAPILAALVFVLYLDTDFLRDGIAIGWGAVAGDHLKSALKRRLGMPPGAPWFADRIDFAIGGALGGLLIFSWMTWGHVLVIVALAYPIHLIGNAISYRMGWRKTPH